MKTIYMFLVTVIIAGIGVFPSVSEAYYTTKQSALKIDDTHALFIIEYRFGHKDYDVYVPVLTERDLAWDKTDTDKVGYTVRDHNKNTVLGGDVSGLVVSKAPIVDGMYKIEKGTAQKLWFVATLTTDTKTPESKYKLQIEKLPFTMGSGTQKKQNLQLNPSELQYYVTPQVRLGTMKNSIDSE